MHEGVPDVVLVIVNLVPDELREATVYPDLGALGLADHVGFEVHDELTDETWTWGPNGNYVRFDPRSGSPTCSASPDRSGRAQVVGQSRSIVGAGPSSIGSVIEKVRPNTSEVVATRTVAVWPVSTQRP